MEVFPCRNANINLANYIDTHAIQMANKGISTPTKLARIFGPTPPRQLAPGTSVSCYVQLNGFSLHCDDCGQGQVLVPKLVGSTPLSTLSLLQHQKTEQTSLVSFTLNKSISKWHKNRIRLVQSFPGQLWPGGSRKAQHIICRETTAWTQVPWLLMPLQH